MPNNVTARIESAPKRLSLAALLAAGAVLIVLLLAQRADLRTLRSGNRTFKLEVAATADAQAKGLGGRQSLPTNQGMLFTFNQSGTRCFWMKDMHFSLDILWLDESRQVRHIEHNVLPGTYPHTFCPSVPARYVIELPAGQAKATGIHDGQQLSF